MDSKTRQNRPDVRLKSFEHKLELAKAEGDAARIAFIQNKIDLLRARVADRAARQVLAICVSPAVYEEITTRAEAEGMTRKAYVERAIAVYNAVSQCYGSKFERPTLEVRA